MKNQYREALDRAKQENKLVLVNFTGYACTNCHWMKANMFPRPEIAEAMKDLVLVELYTDGTDKASEEFQKLEDDKFQTIAIPYYAILDAGREGDREVRGPVDEREGSAGVCEGPGIRGRGTCPTVTWERRRRSTIRCRCSPGCRSG